MKALLATAAASALVLGLAEKKCHNVYAEPHPNDPAHQIALVEAPGSLQTYTFLDSIRGMAQADGFAGGAILVVAGTTLYKHVIGVGPTALTGSIAGTDTVQFAFTETECGILGGGVIHVSSDGSTVGAVTDADFATLLSDAGATEFTSIATLGQRLLFTFGSRFGFSDVLDMDSTTALSYYTAESSPDELIALFVVGDQAYPLGTKTIEQWAQTGVSDDPYSALPSVTQQIGCLCRDGVLRADNTLFFVDNAGNVRRLGQGSSEIVSEPWMASKLQAVDPADIRGLFYEDKGHIFVGWRLPTICFFWDVMMRQPHTRGTNLTDTWRYTSIVSAGTQVFVGDDDGQFDELSRDYTSESMADADTMGTEIVREFTAYLPTEAGRMAIKTVKLQCAKGVGVATGQGVDPVADMRQSKDAGNTFTSWRSRSIGAQGEYGKRTIWRRRGRAKDQGIVFQFKKSDPVKCAYLGVVVNEDMAA